MECGAIRKMNDMKTNNLEMWVTKNKIQPFDLIIINKGCGTPRQVAFRKI